MFVFCTMINSTDNKDGYLTLKEAGEEFGYSADYVGQLIRRGKIEGKQVYANVVWMTTREAMEDYIVGEKNTGEGTKRSFSSRKNSWLDLLASRIFGGQKSSLFVSFFYLLLITLSVVAVFILYILSVSVDHSIKWRSGGTNQAASQSALTVRLATPLAINTINHGAQ